MQTFECLVSEVRHFPREFTKALGSRLIDADGREYVDFLSGRGDLNYGHNDPRLRQRMIEYLEADPIMQSLDMAPAAKRGFLEAFDEIVLRPRGLRYALRFPGAAAVDAALRIARRVTGRRSVIAFSDAVHVDLRDATIMPFDGYFGPGIDTLELLELYLFDRHSGLEKPAAFIVETVQAEGGVNVASRTWLRRLEQVARHHGILLIVDDGQAGCGRCGSFFSFEHAGITPDIVCLSNALSGFGLPLTAALIRPDLERWSPGEHGGHNLAFVTATAALELWRTPDFAHEVQIKGEIVADRLGEIALRRPGLGAKVRGRGLLQGLELEQPGLAVEVARRAFDAGLVIGTCGPDDRVLEVMPPLTISADDLAFGLVAIEAAIDAVAPALAAA